MPDFTWKQNATLPAWELTLTRADGSVPNLTGAAIALNIRALQSMVPVTITGQVTSPDPAGGVVLYTPSSLDTSAPGECMATFTVTYQGGPVEIFPQVGYFSLSIEPGVAGQAPQLVSLPEVKQHLNIPAGDRSRDEKLLDWLTAITPLIENVVGPVIVRTFDEWHDGGGAWVKLRRTPSTALGTTPVLTLLACSEYVGPIEWPLAVIASPDQGQLYSCQLEPLLGRVVRRTAGGGVQAFPYGPQAVHVTYQAGQQTVPANVRRAALEALRHAYTISQETGDGSRALADTPERGPEPPPFGYLPDSCLELLAPNRRHPSLA